MSLINKISEWVEHCLTLNLLEEVNVYVWLLFFFFLSVTSGHILMFNLCRYREGYLNYNMKFRIQFATITVMILALLRFSLGELNAL